MLRNSSASYGWAAIFLHWVSAVTIAFLFGLGLYMVDLDYYDPWYRDALILHKSIGFCLAFLLLIRIAWRLVNLPPIGIGKPMEQIAAKIVHLLLYGFPLILVFSGYLISTADGRSIVVFDWFEVPALPFSFENQESILGEVHEWVAWLLIAFAVVHALAALKHHFVDKDQVLVRILRPNKKARSKD